MSARRRQHLVSTDPRRTTCRRCGRTVLDGIDFGTPYRADAIPLNLAGEVSARVEGRSTYRIVAGRLVRREATDIAADTARGRPAVCATHSCAPVDPGHVDPGHVPVFLELAAETPEADCTQNRNQHALLVLTGEFAGAQVLALPVDDNQPPF